MATDSVKFLSIGDFSVSGAAGVEPQQAPRQSLLASCNRYGVVLLGTQDGACDLP